MGGWRSSSLHSSIWTSCTDLWAGSSSQLQNLTCGISFTHLFWEIKPPTSAQYLIKNKLVAHGRLAFLIFTQQQLDLMHRSLRRVILTAAKLNVWYEFYTHLFREIKLPNSAQYMIKNKLVAHERLAFLIFTQQQLDLMHRSLRRVILTAAKLNMWYQFYSSLLRNKTTHFSSISD